MWPFKDKPIKKVNHARREDIEVYYEFRHYNRYYFNYLNLTFIPKCYGKIKKQYITVDEDTLNVLHVCESCQTHITTPWGAVVKEIRNDE